MLLLLAALTAVCIWLPTPHADDGEALLRRINAAHRPRWFRSLQFVQRTTYPESQRPVEWWYESMLRPGLLRIDIERDGKMVGRTPFRSDSMYQWSDGRPPIARAVVDPLLVLLHDIHVANIDEPLAKLRGLGFDLSRTDRRQWQGRPVIVIGATSGDTTSRQVWIDDGLQVVVRVLQPAANGAMSETRMSGFETRADGAVERRIEFLTAGRVTMLEEYTWINTGATMDDGIFDPAHEALPSWVDARRRAGRGR